MEVVEMPELMIYLRREFASTPRDPNARPQAPARTARIHDGDDFDMFGKIEL